MVASWGCETEGDSKGPAQDVGKICAYDSDCDEHCVVGLDGMAPYCTRDCEDSACPSGYVCVSRGQAGLVCVMGRCAANADCPADYTCQVDPDGVCVHDAISCNTDDDCPAATACNQNVCKIDCDSDNDCKAGYFCHYHSRCVECTSNAHCEDGLACRDGHCGLACIEDHDCRAGFQCEGRACVAIVGGGTGTLGDDCQEHADCEHYCEHGHCRLPCAGPDDTTTCPEGYTCHHDHLYCHQ